MTHFCASACCLKLTFSEAANGLAANQENCDSQPLLQAFVGRRV
jgi:hypothetical protein